METAAINGLPVTNAQLVKPVSRSRSTRSRTDPPRTLLSSKSSNPIAWRTPFRSAD